MIDADQMAVDESEAYMSAQVQITDDLKWLVNFAAHSKIQRLIADTPTVDAVPVVRCNGCKHAKQYERADGTAGYSCGHPQNIFVYGERWDRVFKPVKKPDDFCSFGEPRGAKK